MTDETPTRDDAAPSRRRRRASRPAGPADGNAKTAGAPSGTTGRTRSESSPATTVRLTRPAARPRRRAPHRRLVALVSVLTGGVAVAAVAAVVTVLSIQHRHAEATEARDQRFVDTATQTVVNMFSYTQDNIDRSVNRFVNGTSGPLRDMLSQNNNVDNLKAIFRDTNASSEAVINGAALEKVDEIADNAAVLVAVRVTVTDMDGTNKPSEAYRMRVIVHEDDNGQMTAYDLKYPQGGN